MKKQAAHANLFHDTMGAKPRWPRSQGRRQSRFEKVDGEHASRTISQVEGRAARIVWTRPVAQEESLSARGQRQMWPRDILDSRTKDPLETHTMLGTPRTKTFETRVKTLVPRSMEGRKDRRRKSWRELERTIRDQAAPGRSLTSALRAAAEVTVVLFVCFKQLQ